MNKLVRHRYPVGRLPEDLREGFGPNEDVQVTVEPARIRIEPSRTSAAAQGYFARFKNHFRSNYATAAEIDAYVAALRSEWDDRDR